LTARERIVAAAQAAGADAVRFARAQPLGETRERLSAAFARGDLATWGYDEDRATAAADPQTILAGARSVVCVAVAYATPPPRGRRGRGRVSNYAWSTDYHRPLRTLLRAVARTIDEIAGGPASAIACDTAPLAERAFAASAGLGWIGKHTNLIAPRLGSFVFLGEVVTSLALDPDPPLRTTCGSCTRCITACPTGALRGDYTIDATRCISDLTQRAGSIPRALRPLIGDWVWGCDLCQDVCPPTRRAAGGRPAFAPLDADVAAPDLQALLALRSGEFNRRYKKSAMGWRGAAVLRRNAAIALGNGLDRADVGALGTALRDDPHTAVRAHAAWALGRIGSPKAIALLRTGLESEGQILVLAEIRAALKTHAVDAAL
jgi:epoxyqueuosine reductase